MINRRDKLFAIRIIHSILIRIFSFVKYAIFASKNTFVVIIMTKPIANSSIRQLNAIFTQKVIFI